MMNTAYVEFRNPKTNTHIRFLIEWESRSHECCPGNLITWDSESVPISGFNSDHESPTWRVQQCGGCGSRYAPVGSMNEVGQ